jgi:hypothetical protein
MVLNATESGQPWLYRPIPVLALVNGKQESQDWNKVCGSFPSITRGGFPSTINVSTLILPIGHDFSLPYIVTFRLPTSESLLLRLGLSKHPPVDDAICADF